MGVGRAPGRSALRSYQLPVAQPPVGLLIVNDVLVNVVGQPELAPHKR